MVNAADALERLRNGNRQFVASLSNPDRTLARTLRPELIEDHDPFAIVLGCSDARVPAEIVFDQGLGDLFVIRVAGNIVAPSQVGSVEFAASRFGTRLVVVLGHSQLRRDPRHDRGAEPPAEKTSRPTCRRSSTASGRRSRALLRIGVGGDRSTLVRHAVRANVAASVDHLRHGSALLEQMIRDDGLSVVGAEYSLRDRRGHLLRRLTSVTQ